MAAHFQTALCVGLLAMGLALYFAPVVGAPAADPALPPLVAAGIAMNRMFVAMTKLHWRFTEHTGKALPTVRGVVIRSVRARSLAARGVAA